MIDLLVISHACFTAINRNVYHLFLKDDWKLELVVPKTLKFPSGIKEANKPMAGDPPIHFLSLQGDNPRTYLFEGLIALLDEKKPAIVLLDNDPVSRLALVVGSWCQKNNSKLFCISCENLPLDISSTVKRRGLKALPAAMIKRILLSKTKKVVDGVFSINQDGKKIFIHEGYKLVKYMPLGFDPSYFFPNLEKRVQIKASLKLQYPVIAYFGRLTREKGIHILISALEGLKQYNWHLMMDAFDAFASGYNQEINQMLSNAGIMERVVFINPDHFEIAAYMNAADIVVVPSVSVPNWKEQYGRVAAEAMACGKEVVASNSGSLPELLDGHGELFPEGDITALRKLLVQLLTNPSAIENHNRKNIATYAENALSINRQKTVMEESFTKYLHRQKN